MNSGIEFNPREFKAIGDALIEIGDGRRRYLNKAIKNSLRAGLDVVTDAARRQAPVISAEDLAKLSAKRTTQPGDLVRSIHVDPKISTRKRTIAGRMQTGTREQLGISAGDPNYWPSAVEYGHAAPGNAGGAKVSKPIPFMRTAYETAKAASASAFSAVFRREFIAALRAVTKRYVRALKKAGG